MDFLLIGKIVKPHGLNGALKIFSHTDFAKERYKKSHVVFCFSENEYKPLTAKSFYKIGNFDIVTFEEIADINATKSYIGKELFIKKDETKLPSDTYYFSDLISCEVYYQMKKIGIVKSVKRYPANDVLEVIDEDKRKIQIPFVSEYIIKVDVNKKSIDVNLIEGMI